MSANPNPNAKPKADPKQAPLESPMPRSEILDREEPEFADEPDLPPPRQSGARASPKEAHDAAGVESVAGEEDPGASLDAPAPASPGRRATR
jgi:hypothetical protein